MLSSKNFVITIGNYGAVVALHDNNDVRNKIFLEELSEESKIDLRNLFNKNESTPISVILDTIDQSYKKKSYPSIKRKDLLHIIKRDMASDGDKESFKNFILTDNKKTAAATKTLSKQECLFVSTSNSETINKWLEFLLDMPNRLIGVYMLPVESFQLFELLKSDIKKVSKVRGKSNDLYFLIVQNKVSGVRQVIFSERGIVFTRAVNYNFAEKDFLEKYEQDIYSTFEYLKRLFPDIRISEIDIINIFSNEVLNSIKSIGSSELNFINYTPFQAASKIGYDKLLPENANYCDLLMSKVFAKSKKILKFTTPRINVLERFFNALRLSRYFNALLATIVIVTGAVVFFFKDQTKELLAKVEMEKIAATQNLNRVTLPTLESVELTENGNPLDIERVIDFGKIDENLADVGVDFNQLYIKLRFLKDSDARVSSFSYTLPSFNSKNPTPSKKYSISFKGELTNKSGDIDDLFKAFDSLTTKTKKIFEKDEIRYSDLPRNIDFVQKYYTYPIDFTISGNSATPAANPPASPAPNPQASNNPVSSN